MKKSRLKTGVSFAAGLLIGVCLCTGVLHTTAVAEAEQAELSPLHYDLYVNGNPVTLNEAFIKDGRTYVQLRELCEAVNITVDWSDPRYHMSPIIGGNMPGGINLTVPTYIYSYRLPNYNKPGERFDCVDMTTIYRRYQDDGKLAYCFGTDSTGKSVLLIRENGTEKQIPLDLYPYGEHTYLPNAQFEELILPYLLDICTQ